MFVYHTVHDVAVITDTYPVTSSLSLWFSDTGYGYNVTEMVIQTLIKQHSLIININCSFILTNQKCC
jgi:hypothetical protein